MINRKLDPIRLGARQIKLDRARTIHHPGIFERKMLRMSTSPLAFLRGAAPLFYEILAASPELAKGPGGDGWLVGDAHLENFGAYRPDHLGMSAALKKKSARAHFNLNDFDDAIVGPWRLDVLRLTVSLILGGRELGADGARTIHLCNKLLTAYCASAFGKGALPPVPHPVKALVEAVGLRSGAELLDARTEIVRGKRCFVRGPRYENLHTDVAAEVPRAFAKFVKSLPKGERPKRKQMEIIDAAQRIAGTGSLGSLRVAVLVRGHGGLHGGWIFDMKEQGHPSASLLLGRTKLVPAERVIEGFRSCVEHTIKMLGTTRLAKRSMFVRWLAPQEDKLNLRNLRDSDLDDLASYLGALLGTAHARGATRRPKKKWTATDCGELLDKAIVIAGIHEAVYLAVCKATA